MAYARFGDDSDIYVYLSGHASGWRGYECCRCLLHGKPPEWPTFSTTEEIVAHVKAHLAIGHRVPNWTIDELRREGDANDAWIAEQDPPPDLD